MAMDDTKKQMEEFLKEVENEINSVSLSKEEQAEEIVLTAQTYMEAMTEINNNYNEALKEILSELKEIKLTTDKVKEAKKLTGVRISLFQ